MRDMKRWIVELAWATFAGILAVGMFLAASGCPKPGNENAPAAVKAVESSPKVAKIAVEAAPLSPGHQDEVLAKEKALQNEQARQTTVRHWLIVAAVALGLFALVAGVGKALAGKALGATVWGIALVWVGNQVPWRAVIIAGVACAAAVCATVWLDPLWTLLRDLGWLAFWAGTVYATWELACRRYTGTWEPHGLVTLPKGWAVKK